MPLVSVLIPAYNSAATIRASLGSLRAQTLRDWEAIVVDDGSTDDTCAIVQASCREDPRIHLLRQRNSGPSQARNTAFASSRGEFIALLDADDLWLPDYLATMTSALHGNEWAGLAFCDAYVFRSGTGRVRNETILERRRPSGALPTDPLDFAALLLRDNFIYVGTTARREAYELTDGFSPDLTTFEDLDLWLRMSLRGLRFVEVPSPLALYRVSVGSLSTDQTKMAHALVKMCERLGRPDGPSFTPEGRQTLLQRRQSGLDERERLLDRSLPRRVDRRTRNLFRIVAASARPWVWRRRLPPSVQEHFPDLACL
jgi:glycosyltransferase involved in cell wall biosynthesis